MALFNQKMNPIQQRNLIIAIAINLKKRQFISENQLLICSFYFFCLLFVTLKSIDIINNFHYKLFQYLLVCYQSYTQYLFNQLQYLYNIYRRIMKSLIFLIFALLFNQSLTQNQLSVVGPLSTIAFGCFKDIGYTWSIIRAYHISTSPGAVDVNAAETMINSETAGIPVDAYMVICRNNDPVSQIYTLFSTIDNNLFGDLWIKVEPNSTPGCQWGNNTADNCMFLTEAIAVAQLYKKTIGVFSTATIWNNFFGNSCNIATSSIPLWYADYNATGHVNPTLSYSDFIPFGGWTTPFMKQVGGNVTVSPLCGHSLWHALIDQIYWTAPV